MDNQGIYISVGSNLSNPLDNCLKALSFFQNSKNFKFEKSSKFYRTKPLYNLEQDDFVNFVILIKSHLLPFELLNILKETEKKWGRKKTFANAPRIIDFDIIFYGDKIIRDKNLTIPHLKMQERIFVLKPLCDIEPHLFHPILKKTVKQLLEEAHGDSSCCIEL